MYSVPGYRNDRDLPDPSDRRTVSWYADARKPVPRVWCGSPVK